MECVKVATKVANAYAVALDEVDKGLVEICLASLKVVGCDALRQLSLGIHIHCVRDCAAVLFDIVNHLADRNDLVCPFANEVCDCLIGGLVLTRHNRKELRIQYVADTCHHSAVFKFRNNAVCVAGVDLRHTLSVWVHRRDRKFRHFRSNRELRARNRFFCKLVELGLQVLLWIEYGPNIRAPLNCVIAIPHSYPANSCLFLLVSVRATKSWDVIVPVKSVLLLSCAKIQNILYTCIYRNNARLFICLYVFVSRSNSFKLVTHRVVLKCVIAG